ncbi:MAG: nucleoside triphosphate pyrophosphohydrolase, partial [Porphyromonadaceae bacterium]|nr:nucleoside triphosphate pyrophosphohydrolase [Porphyromonadaceae bacterium]
MLHSREEKLAAMSRLLDVMERLRKDCPWDREQTTESLRTNTLEEVYELSDAILSGRPEEVKKELGDVLLHIVFYSTIGEEQGTFDLCDVANA